MEKKVIGTIVSVTRLWWIKINTKPVRIHALDGATFPHIIKVSYCVNGTNYTKRKLIGPTTTCPHTGDPISVFYQEDNPAKCKIYL